MPHTKDELKDKQREIANRNYNFVQLQKDYSAELQLLVSRNYYTYYIFCFFCLHMDNYNRIKCTIKVLMDIFQIKSKDTIMGALTELYTCGFIDKERKGTANIYHGREEK